MYTFLKDKASPIIQKIDKAFQLIGGKFISTHPEDFFESSIGVARSLDKDGILNLHLFIEVAETLKKVIENESDESFKEKASVAINDLYETLNSNPTSTLSYEVVQSVVFFIIWLLGIGFQIRINRRGNLPNVSNNTGNSQVSHEQVENGENIELQHLNTSQRPRRLRNQRIEFVDERTNN